MSLTPVKRSDPFDFPKSMVPVGMTYQWNAKKVLGEVQESYSRMLADGWVPVPAKWHPEWYKDGGEVIEVQGQVLMCHAHARDAEMESIAGAQRLVDDWLKKYGGFSGGVRVWSGDPNKPPPEFKLIGAEQFAARIVEASPTIVERPQPVAVTQVVIRRIARKPWLRWLLYLISKETRS